MNDSFYHAASQSAAQLAELLEQTGTQIVFAESCTAGLVSGILAHTPGISRFLCGSMATYQDRVKTEWLDINPRLIEGHSSVSAEVTEAMANNVLLETNEARLSIAITGHLETEAAEGNPICFVCSATRLGNEIQDKSVRIGKSFRHELTAETRRDRQMQAVTFCYELGIEMLKAAD